MPDASFFVPPACPAQLPRNTITSSSSPLCRGAEFFRLFTTSIMIGIHQCKTFLVNFMLPFTSPHPPRLAGADFKILKETVAWDFVVQV